MQKTNIQYADYVTNPLRAVEKETARPGYACVPFNDGCTNCWASGINLRFGTHLKYSRPNLDKVQLYLDNVELSRLRTFKPRGPFKFAPWPYVFPCDMTDWLLPEYGNSARRVLYACIERPDMIFLFLTKRYDQLLHLLNWSKPAENIFIGLTLPGLEMPDLALQNLHRLANAGWHVWISHEPALGPLDLTRFEFISLLVSGGESGAGARPSQPDWHRQDRDWAQKNSIPYFFKQWGAYHSTTWIIDGKAKHEMIKVHKKSITDNILDGMTWQQMPGMQ
jgi:protein gp37